MTGQLIFLKKSLCFFISNSKSAINLFWCYFSLFISLRNLKHYPWYYVFWNIHIGVLFCCYTVLGCILDIGFWPPHDCKLIDLSSQDGHSQCPAQPFGIKVDFKVVKPTIANLLTLGNQLWWGSKLFATNLRRYLATLIELLQQQILTLYNLQ